MALVLADRVKETTTVTGTGTATLLGASTGFQSFAVVGNANTTYYCIAGQGTAEWEVGIGTYTSSGTTLARTTVLASSNAGSLVTFSAGTKDVFVTYPAGYSVNATNNAGTAGQVLSSNGTGVAPTWVASKGMTLLGTLTTTSGATQTLSGLTLTPYSMLVVDIFEVSNTGTGGNFTIAGQTITGVSGTASQAISGILQIMLQSGVTTSSVVNNRAIGSTGLFSVTSVLAGNVAITTATTSIAFAMSSGAFDNGTIRVYGVS